MPADNTGGWVLLWLLVFLGSHKKSGWRTVAILALIYLALSSCTPRAYCYHQARQVGRAAEHRKRQALRERRQRLKALRELDAAAHHGKAR